MRIVGGEIFKGSSEEDNPKMLDRLKVIADPRSQVETQDGGAIISLGS